MRLGYFDFFAELPVIQEASMRPRRMRLGYEQRRANFRRIAQSFNEAEAHAPRIRVRRAWKNKWPGCASMRPRRMRLGYVL